MKRSTQVQLCITLDVSETLPIADLLGLDKGEDVPPPSEWLERLDAADLVSQVATGHFEVTVRYDNPAHDPDTIPMFADLAPDPFVTLEVA